MVVFALDVIPRSISLFCYWNCRTNHSYTELATWVEARRIPAISRSQLWTFWSSHPQITLGPSGMTGVEMRHPVFRTSKGSTASKNLIFQETHMEIDWNHICCLVWSCKLFQDSWSNIGTLQLATPTPSPKEVWKKNWKRDGTSSGISPKVWDKQHDVIGRDATSKFQNLQGCQCNSAASRWFEFLVFSRLFWTEVEAKYSMRTYQTRRQLSIPFPFNPMNFWQCHIPASPFQSLHSPRPHRRFWAIFVPKKCHFPNGKNMEISTWKPNA